MTLLLAANAIDARRAAAAGGLAPLARSLAADLELVAARPVWVPPEKARLTRTGGWCPRDGTRLEFDPFAPYQHHCLRCGGTFTGDDHYRWWIVGFQLWLAERAVHGAALALLADRPDLGAFCDRVLDALADAYPQYPNADNALGPTRPFFSTYLESVWLLQLCVALSLREQAGAAASLGGRLRDRVIEPSARLIASFDEGASNRQVWNDAALLAAGGVLGTSALDFAFDGPSGVLAQLEGGLLRDGSWYEGENYHLFAHRGLWYGVELAIRRGAVLPAEATRRLDAGFASPFLTALPDYTFPARRDSAYAVSLRQWRFAELAELGVARAAGEPPSELLGALRTLYDPSIERTTTERARSTAETERNAPASGLSRADLGWRSLLFARAELPPAPSWSPASVLLPDQGLAVMRRDRGAIYAALDYGRSGGGHGHPDRLNLLLSDDDVRWQDDVGTGSYTERTLHWYRSSLAHGAPMVDGEAQQRVDGELLAFDERGDVGLVRAHAAIHDDVRCERTLVVCDDYVISELTWQSRTGDHTLDLPLHVDGDVAGTGDWTPGTLGGSARADDGFAFLSDAECAPIERAAVWTLAARRAGHSLRLWSWTDAPAQLWRALAPGPPGDPAPRRMHLLRADASEGCVLQLWSLRGEVETVRVVNGAIEVERRDGVLHRHSATDAGWMIERRAPAATVAQETSVAKTAASDGATHGPWSLVATLDRGEAPPRHQHDARTAAPHHHLIAPDTEFPPLGAAPVVFDLGEDDYRRSELDWRGAGSPTARVALELELGALRVDVSVQKADPLHVPATQGENPLDNEPADTNADGVQLYVALPDGRGGERMLAWLAVPTAPHPAARVTSLGDPAATVDVRWAPVAGGYVMRFVVALPATARTLALDVVINETSPTRERRRGQLVLSGGSGYVYLRGARQPRDQFLTFSLPHV